MKKLKSSKSILIIVMLLVFAYVTASFIKTYRVYNANYDKIQFIKYDWKYNKSTYKDFMIENEEVIQNILEILSEHFYFRIIDQKNTLLQGHENKAHSIDIKLLKDGKEINKIVIYDDGILIVNNVYYRYGIMNKKNVKHLYENLLKYCDSDE